MRKLIYIFILVFGLGSFKAFAQEENNDWDWDWHGGIKFFEFEKPTIEADFGHAMNNLDGFPYKFENAGTFNLKLGYVTNFSGRHHRHGRREENSYWKNEKRNKYILDSKYNYGYISFGGFSSKAALSKKNEGLTSEVWKLGFGVKDGYLIRMGKSYLLPYSDNSFDWYKINYNLNELQGIDDYRINRFTDAVRFGAAWSAGIQFNPVHEVSFSVGYEKTNIYERHLFWKSSGSMLIEAAGTEMIDHFVQRIFRSSPVGCSIANFILKNAYHFGIYQLRAKEMDWPFKGEPSLTFDSFKFGFGVTF